jgi:hypothetical protein
MRLVPFVKLVAAAISVTTIAACGGGGDSSASAVGPSGYTVESGVAQKGPLAQGSSIFINELTSGTLKPNGK